jgi:hypothetical protein
MKRTEMEKKLKSLGWTMVRRGRRHDIWSKGDGEIPVPRHREINEYTGQAIIRSAERGR